MFAQYFMGDVVMSALTFAELEFGVSASRDPTKERHNLKALIEMISVMPFDVIAASAATRERKSDHLDKLIASHAIALNAILVTNNERDFVIYPDLREENWS